MNAEIEFLKLLIRTCQSVRTPRNPKHRVEMAVPAAQWEILFNQRLHDLNTMPAKDSAKPEKVSKQVAVAA